MYSGAKRKCRKTYIKSNSSQSTYVALMFMTVPIICAHQRHVNAQMILKVTTYVRKRWLALRVTVPPEWIDALFPGVSESSLRLCRQGMPGSNMAGVKQRICYPTRLQRVSCRLSCTWASAFRRICRSEHRGKLVHETAVCCFWTCYVHLESPSGVAGIGCHASCIDSLQLQTSS